MKSIVRLLTMALCLPAVASGVFAQQKTAIRSVDELPRRSIQLKGTALEVIEDRAQLDRLAAELDRNLRADLDSFDIRDRSTLVGYYSTLLLIKLHQRDDASALDLVTKIRGLQDKESEKLTSGLFAEALIKSRREVPDESSAEFRRAFERNYGEAYARLPYATVRSDVEASRGQLTTSNRELVLGSLEAQLQPVLGKTGGVVPEGVAASLVGVRFFLDRRLPLRDEMLRVLTAFSTANASPVAKANIWTSRDVALNSPDGLAPIAVGVWDSGVDVKALPAANRFVNPAEQANGRDDDGNGYVDDVHGIGYDLVSSRKSVGTLDDPAGKISTDARRLQSLTKGSLDLQSGIQSAESAELQRTIASLSRDKVKDFSEELSFYGVYAHGTHVAGIVAAGNPVVRILAARMTWDHRMQPMPYTFERAKFNAQMYRDTVAYFRKHGVRVVNMSWRYNSASIEGTLTANGVGKDEKERKEMARRMFEIERGALHDAIKSAPEILFVCGSGNENNDADFSEYIPASFDLPNLLTVGAVDSEGKRTAFTTEGASVDCYANGFEVESVVPGGTRLKFSGTSMASPQVANLAAKLLAVNPGLTTPDLIRLILEGTDSSSEDSKIRLIDPRKSLALLRKAS